MTVPPQYNKEYKFGVVFPLGGICWMNIVIFTLGSIRCCPVIYNQITLLNQEVGKTY